MSEQLTASAHGATSVAPNEPEYLDDFETQVQREWLITNGLGGYASGTVSGVATRRYHGLLVAAARPPLERWVLLSAVLERVEVSNRSYELASFQFDSTVHPQGYRLLRDFAFSNRGSSPWVRFVYEHDGVSLTKQIILERGRNEVWIRYRLTGPAGQPLSLELCPFIGMRDFHSTTHAFDGGYPTGEVEDYVAVDAYEGGPRLWMSVQRDDEGPVVNFRNSPDWWRGFVYREESARGLDDQEDLFVPGWFVAKGSESIELTFRAVAQFGGEYAVPKVAAVPKVEESEAVTETVEDRLLDAADAFIVSRRREGGGDMATILAGYHWFGDWGRDTFISLPGILLETGRFAEARQVLEVFASAMQDGLIPNRFSDYGEEAEYNSVDASLWFLHAADVYVDKSGDINCWREVLGPACERIVEAFVAGTHFNIHVDHDGLVACGDQSTQLTWMDAKCGDVAFTPRHGKPVEINALWYHGLCVLAERAELGDADRAARYRQLAAQAGNAFGPAFWNKDGSYLYDVVRDDWKDPSVRPNQIFAVSLPHSPLSETKQASVLSCVEDQLLTPYGLRSLSPQHPDYRGRYGGGPYDRDSVYHQGTVWSWLIGPYVDAYLRVHGTSDRTRVEMRGRLQPLIDHLDSAGLGSVSEIFDGDAPHAPRGCVAQAWSVAELLRSWRMVTAAHS